MKESLGVQYKVLRWSLAFFWWLMVTAGVVLIGCLVAFNAGWMDTDTATLDIPVEIQLEEGTYTLTQNEGIPGQVELEDVVGTLSVPLHDSHLGLWLLLILLYAAFMWGTKLLRDVVLSLPEGPFNHENGQRITIIGFLMLGFTVVYPFLPVAIATDIDALVQVEGLVMRAADDLEINIAGFLPALLVLVLGQVFRYGAALEDDQKLTV